MLHILRMIAACDFCTNFRVACWASELRLINIPSRLSWWFGIYCFTYSISLNVFVWCDFLGSLKSIGDSLPITIWNIFDRDLCWCFVVRILQRWTCLCFFPAGSHCSLDVSACVWIEESHEAKHEQRWKEESLWLYKAWLLDWMIVWLYIHLFIHSFIHSFIHWWIHSFIHWWIHCIGLLYNLHVYDWFLWFSLREDSRSIPFGHPPCKLPICRIPMAIMESPAGFSKSSHHDFPRHRNWGFKKIRKMQKLQAKVAKAEKALKKSEKFLSWKKKTMIQDDSRWTSSVLGGWSELVCG